jgi:hypothetical protein
MYHCYVELNACNGLSFITQLFSCYCCLNLVSMCSIQVYKHVHIHVLAVPYTVWCQFLLYSCSVTTVLLIYCSGVLLLDMISMLLHCCYLILLNEVSFELSITDCELQSRVSL